MLVSHISLIEDVTELSSALVEASRLELELTGSKPVALPLGYAPMTTPPFYSEERWGLYHECVDIPPRSVLHTIIR